MERDMALFAQLGIRLVVTLTEDPLDPSPEDYGFRSLHLPTPDMGAPEPAAALAVCREIALSISRGEPAVLHCKAGLGRTGTLLACTLVALGHTAEQAVAAVRRVCPLYIQSEVQEEFVARFATLDRGE
jgi:atypical dual specificity phosphatase